MFTEKTICEEIHQFVEGPVTPESTKLLACLLYIKEHCEMLPGEKISRETLLEWVDHMENADGTVGPHWSLSESEAIRTQYSIPCKEIDFYAALNMMYSDYCGAVTAMGAGSVGLYARMAEAFLTDKDAQPEKLSRYYEYIAARNA